MSSYRQWIVAAGTAVAVMCPAWAGAPKPAGGICDCGAYAEAPAVCAPLKGAKRNACIRANTSWLDKCTAWRNDFCSASAAAAAPARTPAMSLPSAAPATQPPVARRPVPAAVPPAPAPATILPEVVKFGGDWTGEAQCRSAADKWRLAMQAGQTANGALVATASTSQAFGASGKVELKGDDVVMRFESLLSDTIYAGRLVEPNRIEGKVHVAGRDCKWYLKR